MTQAIAIAHAYSPEQYQRAVEVWKRLLDNPYTSAYGSYERYLESVPDDHLYALIMSDGAETTDEHSVTVMLASYSDYGGSCLDAANVRELAERYGFVNTRTGGVHGAGSAWVQLGELPTVDDIDHSLDLLAAVADDMDRLTDYPLLSDESHSEYVDELAEEAWDSYLGWDVMRELEDMAGGDFEDFGYSDDEIREMYYSYEENEWNCETATSVVNGRHDEAVAHIFDSILAAWRKPWIDPNQLALP